jgi:hypothetical protein
MRVDPEALLVALVLAPATYSRNRFFPLYLDPSARRARRRAGLVRSVLRHAAHFANGDGALSIEPDGEGFIVRYVVPSLGLRRTVMLDAIEIALVRNGVARRSGGSLPEMDADRLRIESALQRLGGVTAFSEPPAPEGAQDVRTSEGA